MVVGDKLEMNSLFAVADKAGYHSLDPEAGDGILELCR